MSLTKNSIFKEALKRAEVSNAKPIELDPRFNKQNDFIKDPARYISARCSRRSGKTNGLAYRFHFAMDKYPKSTSIYLGLTLDSARGAMWPAFEEFNDRYNLGYTFVESKSTIIHPNGAKLRILGADMQNFIKRLRGRKYPAAAIDEAQDFGTHLESLIDDVLTPSIADYKDGWIAITGTPGPVPQGYFFDVTFLHKFGFSHHEWTIFDNPHMPDPNGFLADLIKRKGWTEDTPTLRREWRNEWIRDDNALWVKYHASKSEYDELPKGHQWSYLMGVDIGFNDADAIAILAWAPTCRETYLVHEDVRKKQNISDLVAQIDRLQKQYNVYKIVMDEGGLGKKIGEEIRRRFSCPIEPADKANKQDNVTFLNDDLAVGLFKAKESSMFAQDSYKVQIDWDKTTPTKIVLKKNYHSDIIDAVLYAFRESYAFTHEPEVPKPVYGSKAWAQAEADKMFDAELEAMLAAKELEREYGNYGNND